MTQNVRKHLKNRQKPLYRHQNCVVQLQQRNWLTKLHQQFKTKINIRIRIKSAGIVIRRAMSNQNVDSVRNMKVTGTKDGSRGVGRGEQSGRGRGRSRGRGRGRGTYNADNRSNNYVNQHNQNYNNGHNFGNQNEQYQTDANQQGFGYLNQAFGFMTHRVAYSSNPRTISNQTTNGSTVGQMTTSCGIGRYSKLTRR